MYQILQRERQVILKDGESLLRLTPINQRTVRITATKRDHFLPEKDTENFTPVVLNKEPERGGRHLLETQFFRNVFSEEGKLTQKESADGVKVTGGTFLTALGLAFPHDPATYSVNDQFLFGPSLLVCPVTKPMYYETGSKPLENTLKSPARWMRMV